jgi:hypothetical protein
MPLYFCYLRVDFKERAELSPSEGFNPGWLASENYVKQVVGVTGVEPVTLRLSSACSNQLSYTPARRTALKVGGAEESRTPDL